MQKDYERVQRGVKKKKQAYTAEQFRRKNASKLNKASKVTKKVSKARQADLDKMTPNQRYAEEGYLPYELVRQPDGSLKLDQKFVGKAEAIRYLKSIGEGRGGGFGQLSKASKAL